LDDFNKIDRRKIGSSGSKKDQDAKAEFDESVSNLLARINGS